MKNWKNGDWREGIPYDDLLSLAKDFRKDRPLESFDTWIFCLDVFAGSRQTRKTLKLQAWQEAL